MPDTIPDDSIQADGLVVLASESLGADITNIGSAVGRVMRALEAGLSEDARERVELALQEAVSNAVVHGSKRDPTKTVRILAARDGRGGLVFVVRDMGDGFDPAAVPDPFGADRVQATSGRGVFLIRQLMDRVDFLDDGRTIRMHLSGYGIASPRA